MIQAIVAVIDKNNGIGKNGKLLVQIPEDMQFFKKKTMGSVVIMGSKTYESIPKKFRPLPGRINIPLSKSGKTYPGVFVLDSLKKAINKYRDKNIFIIGGGQVYREALPYVEKVLLTRIYADKEADTFFPDLKKNGFKRVWASPIKKDKKTGIQFRFESWKRK